MMSPADPLAKRLFDLGEQGLAAMPTPKTTAFHIEVFRQPNDELVVCEVASRAPAAQVPSLLQMTWNLDIHQALTRAACGLNVSWPARLPKRLLGCYYVPPRVGHIKHLPDEPDWNHCSQHLFALARC